MTRFRRTREEIALHLTPKQAKNRRSRNLKQPNIARPTSSSYTEISYEGLGDWVGRKTMVKVSKEWLNKLISPPSPAPSLPSVGANLTPQREESPKIEFKITDLND